MQSRVRSEADSNQLDDHGGQAWHTHAQQVEARRGAGVDEEAQAEADELQEAEPGAEEALPVEGAEAEEGPEEVPRLLQSAAADTGRCRTSVARSTCLKQSQHTS